MSSYRRTDLIRACRHFFLEFILAVDNFLLLNPAYKAQLNYLVWCIHLVGVLPPYHCMLRLIHVENDNERKMPESSTQQGQRVFLSSHSIFHQSILSSVFGICVPERKRTEGMQETQQYNPAMWWPPLNNPRHPLLSATSTDYCCIVQQKSFI